jgi:hypothetical protein
MIVVISLLGVGFVGVQMILLGPVRMGRSQSL